MAYLGNDLQVAFPVYRNIDDISGSFNSSTTSFPLRVSGVAPVPAPLYSQQCLISVGGVVQRPDDTGSEGFRLSGGNIIFASAPTTGADFFGVILAGADYINAGGNFPSGTAAVPSITFNDDLDTGIYNSGTNQLSITTGGSERLRIDSAGQIESVSLGTAATPAFSFTSDPNTGIYSPGADQVAISTGGSGRLFVDASGRVGVNTASPQRALHSSGGVSDNCILATSIAGNAFIGFADVGTTDQTGLSVRLGSSGNSLVFQTGGTSERLRITSAGFVGVGTSVPRGLVSVSNNTVGGGVVDSSVHVGYSVADFYGFRLTNSNDPSSTYGGLLKFQRGTGAAWSDALTINNTGNVGIGTTSPATALHIVGAADTIARVTAANGSTALLDLGTVAAPTAGRIFYDNGNNLGFSTNGSEKLRITSAGLVGVGTSAPQAILHSVPAAANGTAAPAFIATQGGSGVDTGTSVRIGYGTTAGTYSEIAGAYSGAGTYLDLKTSNNDTTAASTKLRITAGGNVGIGTTSPQTPLHVSTANSEQGRFESTGASYINVKGSAGQNLLGVEPGAGWVGPIESIALAFKTGNSERARLTASGQLLVGTSSARSNFYNGANTAQIQLEGTNFQNAAFAIVCNANSDDKGSLILAKNRGTTVGSNTIVQDGDDLGSIEFQGSDGAEFVQAAAIKAEVDGTPGANDMPGRLVFSTTADGASSPTERMRIVSNGDILFSNLGAFYPNTDNAVSLGISIRRWTAVFAVNGTIQTSDEREKTEVANSALGSEFIKSLRPVSYKWIEGGQVDTGRRDEDGNYIYESVPGVRTHWGFIAQEVKQAVDAAGVDFGGWVLTDKDDPDSQQALRYDQFVAPLTKALQEALEKIETLEAKVAALESA